MRELKNLLIASLNEDLFEGKICSVLFLYNSNEELVDYQEFVNLIKGKFKSAHFEYCCLNTHNSQIRKKKFDMVIPVKPYQVSLEVNREMESFAFKLKTKYFVIYESDYGSIRMARKRNLFYRLYLQLPATLMYMAVGSLFISIPAYFFYVMFNLKNILKKLCLRK